MTRARLRAGSTAPPRGGQNQPKDTSTLPRTITIQASSASTILTSDIRARQQAQVDVMLTVRQAPTLANGDPAKTREAVERLLALHQI